MFSLGRLPEDARGYTRAHDTASRLHAFLAGRRMAFGEAGRAMGVSPNSLRYAGQTGRALLRWEGARQPVVWTIPAPNMAVRQAQLELARRYLHIFGPATAASFAEWAGIGPMHARAAFEALGHVLISACTPTGDAWILADDEEGFRTRNTSAAPARLLPSGDAYFLLWGADRELLMPDARRRAELLTSRVWPGALLVKGEVAGVWRRAAGAITIEAWRRFSARERENVEAEATQLPIPDLKGPITIRWC